MTVLRAEGAHICIVQFVKFQSGSFSHTCPFLLHHFFHCLNTNHHVQPPPVHCTRGDQSLIYNRLYIIARHVLHRLVKARKYSSLPAPLQII
jgi:hypothetical protein